MNYSEWIQGIPPIEAVAEHEKNHPANTSGVGQGYGNWLCVGPHGELVLYRLRAVNGEVLQSTGWHLRWTSPTTYRPENAKYFPVGADGLPINMCLTYCVYCGDKATYASAEERDAGMLEHIAICEKRPEMKLLRVALAAEELMNHIEPRFAVLRQRVADFDEPDGITRYQIADEALGKLRIALDRLKVKPEGNS